MLPAEYLEIRLLIFKTWQNTFLVDLVYFFGCITQSFTHSRLNYIIPVILNIGNGGIGTQWLANVAVAQYGVVK
jgi:hypothetical protein